MGHGFTVLNNNAQVLISNQAYTLHFVGKAIFNRTITTNNTCGGYRVWAFRISCTVPPVPFFSMPTADFYAVVSVRQVSTGVWDIEVLRSGTSATLPEVYVFCDPNGIAYSGTETHGIRVLCEDGSVAFDSRLSPLVVTGGAAIVPPASPVNPDWYIQVTSGYDTGLPIYTYFGNYYWYTKYRNPPLYSSDTHGPGDVAGNAGTGNPSNVLTPTNFNTYPVPLGGSKPIYFFPSLAQCTRIASGYYEANIYYDARYQQDIARYRCNSNYWALYRGAISLLNNVLRCGWVPYVQGNYWKAMRVNSGITIGSGVDASSMVGSGSGGNPPYYNMAYNVNPTALIVGNGARYD